MSNPMYTHTDGVPVQGSRGVSATMRNELDLVEDGFDIAQNYSVDTGSVNAIVIAPPAALVTLSDGLRFWIKAANTITGATTVNMGSTLGTKDLRRVDGTAMSNEIVAAQIFLCAYNLSAGYLVYLSAGLPGASNGLPTTGGTMTGAINEAKGANIASASTVNLQTATGNIVHITGTTAITAFTLNQGARRLCIADGAFTLTHNASSLICPTGANIVCAVGDTFEVFAESNNNVRITDYMRADGTSLVQFGNGGTTATGNVTLTATSSSVQVITPAAPGYYATLPNASSLNKGGPMFSFFNAGDYDYGLKDSTGTVLGWIRPKTGVTISLAANSAAGTWSIPGIAKTGVTAQLVNLTASNTTATTNTVIITIDSNRKCIVTGGTTVCAVVYDSSQAAGSQWGSVATVRTGISSSAFLAILSGASQVLVVSNDSTTGMEAVTLTIDSTTGITVNTGSKGTATLAGNWAAFGQLKAVGSAWVVSYGRATTVSAIRPISISGTTPTIGNESAATTASGSVSTAPTIYAWSSSIVLAIESTSSNLYTKPWTVSGSSNLVAGTEASTATSAAAYRTQAMGSGNIAAFHLNTSLKGGVISVSGTVAAISVATLSSAVTPTNATTTLETVAASNTKICTLYHAGSTTFALNHLIDTSGTASAGTEVTQTVVGNMTASNSAGIGVSGSNALFFAQTSTAVNMAINVDTSGTSPVLSSVIPMLNGSVLTLKGANIYNTRSGNNLYSGSDAYSIAASGTAGNSFGLHVNSSGIQAIPLPNTISTSGLQAVSAAANESWAQGAFGATGITLCRLEAAA